MLFPITNEIKLNRLREENTWWSSGKISDFYQNLPKRDYLELTFPMIKEMVNRRAAVLLGNKTGKTVLVHHAIAQLIQKGISPHKIAYISLKNRFLQSHSLLELFEFSQEATGQNEKDGWYVFYDHLEYQIGWASELEKLVDRYPSVKFVAISNINFNQEQEDLGKGRFSVVYIPPLTFYEYLNINQLQHLLTPSDWEWEGNILSGFQSTNIGLLNEIFIKYINQGGTFEFLNQNQNTEFLDGLHHDLYYYYGLKNPEELLKLIEIIAYNSGSQFSFELLNEMMDGIEKNTLKKYLKFLEKNYLISVIDRLDQKMKPYERANFFTLHFNNLALRSNLLEKITATDIKLSQVLKSVVWLQMPYLFHEKTFYSGWIQGRYNFMVDSVGTHYRNPEKKWLIQTQWNNHYFDNFFDLKSVFQFCENNRIEQALITTIDKSGKKVSNRVKYTFVPAAVLAYTLSYNAIVNKIQLNL